MLALVVPVVALAVSSSGYADKRASATPINNLGRFLEGYVGDCESDEPTFDKNGCEAAAAAQQKKLNGQIHVMEVESPGDHVVVAAWEAGRQAFRLHVTPFFSERGLALSGGRPEKLNADGMPIVKNVPVWVTLPKGVPEFSFRRDLERGKFRMELLMRPRRAWRIKGKEGPMRGADVDVVGVRIMDERTGEILAEQTY